MVNEFKEELNAIHVALEEITVDMPKLEKGVSKAARRVRKNLQVIAKAAKTGRGIALDISKAN
jgi:hypothetical protein